MNAPRPTDRKPANPPPRRSGWRWLPRILLVLVVLVLGGLSWILFSASGAGFVLARVQAALDGKLVIGRHEGSLAGPLRLEGLRYLDPASGVDAGVDRIEVDVDLLALFNTRVSVRSVAIDGVRLDLTTVPEDPDKAPGDLSLKAPIDIAVEQLGLRSAAISMDGEPLLAVDSLDLVAGWTAHGIVVRKLDLRSPDGEAALTGSLVTAQGYSGDGETNFRWKIADVQLAGVLKSQSDGKNAQLQLDLTEPTPLALTLGIGQSRDAPWTLQLDAPAFDAKKILPDSTLDELALALQGTGNREQGSLSGTASINGHQVRLDPLRFALADKVLRIEALKLSSPQTTGHFELHGDLGFAATPVSANLVASWDGVELPADLVGQALDTQGRLDVEGDLNNYGARGELTIGPAGKPANITIDIHGDGERVTLDAVNLKQASGGLDATGTITLKPVIGWQIDARGRQLDPGAFVAEWSGALDFVLASTGQMTDQGPTGSLRLDALTGNLHQRPISGSADLRMDAGYVIDGTLALKSGESTLSIEGKGGTTTDANIRFAIASLGDFLPDSSGRLDGRFHVSGKWPGLDLDGEAHGLDLDLADTQIATLEVVTRLKDLEAPSGALTLKTGRIDYANLQFDTLTLEAEGNRSAHQMKLDAQGTPANLALLVKGAGDGAGWKGQLESLSLVPSRRNTPRLDLGHPAAMDWDGQHFSLEQGCLVGSPQVRPGKPQDDAQDTEAGSDASMEAGINETPGRELPARLCVGGLYGVDGSLSGRYRIEHLPLRLLLRLASPDSPIRLRGELAGEGDFNRPVGGQLSGQALLQSSEGQLFFLDGGNHPALSYKGFNVTANLGPAANLIQVAASLENEGRIDGRLSMNAVDDGPAVLDGYLKIDLNSLAFIELLTSEVQNIQGSLHADYTIAGTLAAPKLNGALTLADFATEVPSAGLKLNQGSARLRATDSEHFAIEASLASGSGTLSITGQGELAAGAPLTLTIKGEDFLAADIPAAKAFISPDVSIERNADGIFVKGKITIPKADIDVAKLPGGGTIEASSDVVVVDAEEPAKAKPLPITANVTIALGDEVKLTGYGFDGRIVGELAVSDRPGRVTTANGALDATGTYYAYGQNLKIETGRVLFANTPIDNPALDIRAVRRIESESITAGLNIRGNAQQPELTVFSVPARESADALSYLVTGKPMTGGASFTFGKYLSPKLYLSYGVGIFEPGEVVTLRYLINPKWNFEAINTSEGNRAGINYRIEK